MMTNLLTSLSEVTRRFLREDRASLSIEAAIMLPVLLAIYVAGYQFFDQYRREAHMFKASYAVADRLSRRTETIYPSDLNGLEGVYETLTYSEGASYMRFTEVWLTGGEDKMVWSYATDGQPQMTNTRLQAFLNQIPTMDDNDRITLVEAYTYDDPFFNVGLDERIIPNFIPIRQRYGDCLPYSPEVSELPNGCTITGNGGVVAVNPEAPVVVGGVGGA